MKFFLFFTLIALAAGSAMAQVNLSSSLVACYQLNGNANDPINAFTGTLSAVTPTVDRFNNPNSAYSFAGTSSSYIELPDNPLLKPSNAISFSAWIKTEGFVNSTAFIVYTKNDMMTDFEAYALTILPLTGGFKFGLHKGQGGFTDSVHSKTVPLINTWYHVVFTIDNSNLQLFVNGILERSKPTTLSFVYGQGKRVYWGCTNEPTNYLPWKGSIDNARFYNRVISAAEVNALFTTDPSCVESTALLGTDQDDLMVSVYPNPNNGEFTIKGASGVLNSLSIYNILGEEILTGKLEPTGKNDISLANQPKGVYLLKIKNAGDSKIIRVIKE